MYFLTFCCVLTGFVAVGVHGMLPMPITAIVPAAATNSCRHPTDTTVTHR